MYNTTQSVIRTMQSKMKTLMNIDENNFTNTSMCRSVFSIAVRYTRQRVASSLSK